MRQEIFIVKDIKENSMLIRERMLLLQKTVMILIIFITI